MGYTHYFPQKRAFTDVEWDSITDATRKILSHPSAPRVVYEYDEEERPAEIGPKLIRFNGVGEDEGHETFLITKDHMPRFNFCKTARKPYDDAVTAVLILMNHFAKDALKIGSDGEPSDWSVGLRLAMNATGLSLGIPILRDDAD